MAQARLGEITRLFFRVGTTVFGGGNPAIAVLQREFDRRGWLSPEKFALSFGLARLTPGTNFLAFCAATGWYLRGIVGAAVAVLGTTIPASVLVVWLTRAGEVGNGYPWARSVIAALLAAGVGTMLGAAVLLVRSQCTSKELAQNGVRREIVPKAYGGARRTLRASKKWLRPVVIAVGAFVLARAVGLSPLSVIGIAAAAGFFWTES